MPRITAATVAEHRATQHRAILDAAARLIDESDGRLPSLTEVARAVGLARTSVYQYVDNTTDLVVQLLLDVIPEWNRTLAQQMAAVGDEPAARLGVYVDSTFKLFADGLHAPLMNAARTVPEAFAHPRVQDEHNALMPALHGLLDEGQAGGAVGLALLDAAIQRGAELVAEGAADRAGTLAGLHRMAAGLVAGGQASQGLAP